MFGRMVLGLPTLYRTWTCPSNHIIVKLMGTGLILQSINFIMTMVKILKARASEYAERKAKNVKMKWFTPLNKEELDKIEAYKKKPNQKQYVP
jgi:hypothetical protein